MEQDIRPYKGKSLLEIIERVVKQYDKFKEHPSKPPAVTIISLWLCSEIETEFNLQRKEE